MRRSLFFAAAVLSTMFVLFFPASGQNNPTPAPPSSDAQLAAYTKAMQARDWPGAVSIAQEMVSASPTAENLCLLGNAQLNAGAFADSLATYDRGLAEAEKKKPLEGQPDTAWKATKAKIYLWKGNALLKSHRNGEAVEAYTHAAELDPNPGTAYFNICATLYNIGDTQNSTPACRKAVQSDPAKADAWFVLASLLYVDAKTDAQGKMIISSECRQALDKYLALAPDGPHVSDVKAMLDMAAK